MITEKCSIVGFKVTGVLVRYSKLVNGSAIDETHATGMKKLPRLQGTS